MKGKMKIQITVNNTMNRAKFWVNGEKSPILDCVRIDDPNTPGTPHKNMIPAHFKSPLPAGTAQAKRSPKNRAAQEKPTGACFMCDFFFHHENDLVSRFSFMNTIFA